MKDISQYICEADINIEFQGQQFQMDHIIGSNVHHDIDMARTVEHITDDMWKSLKKQGVKYVLCFPPHYYSSTGKNDVFIIKMFIKSKKMFTSYQHTQMYAVYDVKTHECINKDDIKAYKVIRYE